MNTFSLIANKLNSSNSDTLYNFDLAGTCTLKEVSDHYKTDFDNTINNNDIIYTSSKCNFISLMLFKLIHKYDIQLIDKNMNGILITNTYDINGFNKLSKFQFFKMINDITFIPKDVRTYINSLYIRSQRHYNAFCRLAYHFKFKRSPVIINTDLYLAKLSSDNPNVITILHNKQRYLFNITDLIKIITSSLSNSPYFVSEPLACKNPYNNLPFTIADLYNIYFQVKLRIIKMPILLYQFFLCNFNLTVFQRNNRTLIRETYIRQFINNEDKDVLLDYIYDMLTYNNEIQIDLEFPDDILLDIFKPYLTLYLNMCYSLDMSVRRQSRIIIKYKLNEFNKFNPAFGRKIILVNNKSKCRVSYNTNHISYDKIPDPYDKYNLNKCYYLKSHTSLATSSYMNDDEDDDDDDDDEDDEDEDDDDDDDNNDEDDDDDEDEDDDDDELNSNNPNIIENVASINIDDANIISLSNEFRECLDNDNKYNTLESLMDHLCQTNLFEHQPLTIDTNIIENVASINIDDANIVTNQYNSDEDDYYEEEDESKYDP